ncbi:hypothetical protein [Bacillus sp. KH172YL63]|nr:hypothetical protein [Bacillus sp. KH172YL63]BCB03123.1 hypothetical protein KH172YL63_12560 [Bacillus sp. KH172YL63]
MTDKKQSFREEFGQEFGDVNAAKIMEVTQKQPKDKKKIEQKPSR